MLFYAARRFMNPRAAVAAASTTGMQRRGMAFQKSFVRQLKLVRDVDLSSAYLADAV
jgi:hypothetical protein